MLDVRSCLGVKSVIWKIEKRVMVRIGHLVRMENDRLIKTMVFGGCGGSGGKREDGGIEREDGVDFPKPGLRERISCQLIPPSPLK